VIDMTVTTLQAVTLPIDRAVLLDGSERRAFTMTTSEVRSEYEYRHLSHSGAMWNGITSSGYT